jgi:hypothetical protein
MTNNGSNEADAWLLALTKERAIQWPLNILSVILTIQRCSS